MPSLEYLRKQKCMLEQLIVKQKRILEQCKDEDTQEQQMEQYAKEMVDVFLSRFGESKMDMLLKNSLDEYKRILLSIFNRCSEYEYVKFYGTVYFNIIKYLSKDFYKEYVAFGR